MCLIINVSETTTTFNDAWLADFFDMNRDGFGFMWADKNGLQVWKAVPKSVDEFIKAFRNMEGRPFVCHLRMKTHGAIDLANAHPYKVMDKKDGDPATLYMMHNGVLNGAAFDQPHMSDTWHFIRDTVRPLVDSLGVNAVFDPQMVKLLGSCIGKSNKLVFMDDTGRISIVNSDAGVEFQGAWLSNTYAWSYMDRKREVPAPKSVGRTLWSMGWDDDWESYKDPNVSASVSANIRHLVPTKKVDVTPERVTLSRERLIDLGYLTWDELEGRDYSEIHDLCVVSPEVVTEFLYSCIEYADFGATYEGDEGDDAHA